MRHPSIVALGEGLAGLCLAPLLGVVRYQPDGDAAAACADDLYGCAASCGPAGTAAATAVKSMAVLPFENLGPADDAYFADGLEQLPPLIADGLVTLEPGFVRVTQRGRLLAGDVVEVAAQLRQGEAKIGGRQLEGQLVSPSGQAYPLVFAGEKATARLPLDADPDR